MRVGPWELRVIRPSVVHLVACLLPFVFTGCIGDCLSTFVTPDCRHAASACAPGFRCTPTSSERYTCLDVAGEGVIREVSLRSPSVSGPKVELGEIIVNLNEPGGDRYLKVRVELELDREETRTEVETRISQIRFELVSLLSSRKLADVQGGKNIESLRKAMLLRANSVIKKGRITGVWPSEWVVQ